MRVAGVLFLSAVLSLGACNGVESPVVCTLEARAGINVTVLDARTGAPVADATVVARQAGFAETLNTFRAGEHFGVFERPGTYTVTIEAPGYKPWRADRIVVRADECHVIPVRLSARLDPAS